MTDGLSGLIVTQQPTTRRLRFIEQAWLGRNAWWRYLVAIGLLIVLYWASIVLLSVIYEVVARSNDVLPSIFSAPDDSGDLGLVHFGLALAAIASGLPILILVVRLFHRRSWRTLVVGPQGFDWSAFFHSLGLILAINLFYVFVVMTIWPGAQLAVGDSDRFLIFVTMAAALVPLQTLAEEAVFRGYLLQGVARASRNFAVRLIVPALLFAVVHFNNPIVASGGLWILLDYVIVALYLTFLTLRSDGIERSWGFHLGNDWLAFIFIRPAAGDFDIPTLIVVDGAYGPSLVVVVSICCALHYALLLRFRAPRSRQWGQ